MWFGAVLAALVMGVVLAFSGVFLVVPTVLALGALFYTRPDRAGRRDDRE